MNRADDFQLALEISDLAAECALAHFSSGIVVTLKSDGTPVTDADRAVERLLVQSLSATRPTDAVLGEEYGQVGDAERVWILDPIDGTESFIRGDPNWRIHVALKIGEFFDVGVVTAPALRRCWWATRGGGAYESTWPREVAMTRKLQVSSTTSLETAVIEALEGESTKRLPPRLTRSPTTPLPLIELVRGEIDAFLAERYYAWDHAPWILLVEEAGGRFTDRNGGHACDQGGGLYSNATLHDHLLTVLRYPTG